MKKPTASAIASAPRLTALHPEWRTFDDLHRCHLCGTTSAVDGLGHRFFRECDEHDRPIAGADALLCVCASKACHKRVTDHPRLYDDEPHTPGHMLFCGPCAYRRGVECTHPDLRANGGAGLMIRMSGTFGYACGRGGCRRLTPTPFECTGLVERERSGA